MIKNRDSIFTMVKEKKICKHLQQIQWTYKNKRTNPVTKFLHHHKKILQESYFWKAFDFL